jgi:hypothetical protein
MRPVSADQLRAYAQRDWAGIARTKQRGTSVDSHAEALALSQSLWDHMRQVDPHWPDDAQRRDDFEHHVRLVQLGGRLRDAGFRR